MLLWWLCKECCWATLLFTVPYRFYVFRMDDNYLLKFLLKFPLKAWHSRPPSESTHWKCVVAAQLMNSKNKLNPSTMMITIHFTNIWKRMNESNALIDNFPHRDFSINVNLWLHYRVPVQILWTALPEHTNLHRRYKLDSLNIVKRWIQIWKFFKRVMK